MAVSLLKDRRLQLALTAALALAAYANTLTADELIRDDRPIIEQNQLLRSLGSAPTLFTVGYWDGALGKDAADQEYRPVLMLSYLFTRLLFGDAPWAHHLVNILLHCAVCVLLLLLLRRDFPERVALAAAVLFAVLPVHSEAVGCVTGRSEPWVLLFLLLSWLELSKAKPRLWRGLLFYALALLSKEQAMVFPAVLFLHDRTKKSSWKGRRGVYCGLGACLAAYLVLRTIVLTDSLRVGEDYFGALGALERLLTMSRFCLEHYLLPMATGLGIQTDFTRPFYPDASLSDAAAWLCLAGWTLLLGFSCRRLIRKRSPYAFWVLAAFVYWLPTSNLLVPLNEIGAPRFVYMPSAAFCLLLGSLLSRLPRRAYGAALALLVLWYGGLTLRENRLWLSEKAYYEAVRARNPHARGLVSLGLDRLRHGDAAGAEELFRRAVRERPRDAAGHYDLGRLLWEQGRREEAAECMRRAAAAAPRAPDVNVFLGVIAESRGRRSRALDRYEAALAVRPWDARARYNAGRLLLLMGRTGPAEVHLREFLRLAPKDPDAAAVRRLLAGIEKER